jgi:hypothetical protein
MFNKCKILHNNTLNNNDNDDSDDNDDDYSYWHLKLQAIKNTNSTKTQFFNHLWMNPACQTLG